MKREKRRKLRRASENFYPFFLFLSLSLFFPLFPFPFFFLSRREMRKML